MSLQELNFFHYFAELLDTRRKVFFKIKYNVLNYCTKSFKK